MATVSTERTKVNKNVTRYIALASMLLGVFGFVPLYLSGVFYKQIPNDTYALIVISCLSALAIAFVAGIVALIRLIKKFNLISMAFAILGIVFPGYIIVGLMVAFITGNYD
jgi:hypothetical protein